MNTKELTEQVTDNWTELSIKVSNQHLERIHAIAEEFNLTLNQAATHLFHGRMQAAGGYENPK